MKTILYIDDIPIKEITTSLEPTPEIDEGYFMLSEDHPYDLSDFGNGSTFTYDANGDGVINTKGMVTRIEGNNIYFKPFMPVDKEM